ncbi:MAG: type II toxin-antitoxin system prevent-host-death family antitoxin [Planctomycetota bacterium]
MKSVPTNEVGVFEAKTNLSQLIERVERGESVVITRHGTPVAKLVPYADVVDRQRVKDAVQGLMDFKGGKLKKGLTLKKLIAEGRS